MACANKKRTNYLRKVHIIKGSTSRLSVGSARLLGEGQPKASRSASHHGTRSLLRGEAHSARRGCRLRDKALCVYAAAAQRQEVLPAAVHQCVQLLL